MFDVVCLTTYKANAVMSINNFIDQGKIRSLINGNILINSSFIFLIFFAISCCESIP